MRAEQPGALPGTVLDVISYRIAPARAGQPGRAAGRAVAGASFSVGVVAQMLGVAVLALLDPVDECQAAAFLVAGDRPGDYRFSHALVRSAVAAQLSAADQRRWHVAAADAIERLYSASCGRTWPSWRTSWWRARCPVTAWTRRGPARRLGRRPRRTSGSRRPPGMMEMTDYDADEFYLRS